MPDGRETVGTVGRLLKHVGLDRLSELDPAPSPTPPIMRYQLERPDDLLRLDVKKLGRRMTKDRQRRSRGAGWDYVHVAVDDRSPVAFTSIHPETRQGAAPVRLSCKPCAMPQPACSLHARDDRQRSLHRIKTVPSLGPTLGTASHPHKPYTPQTNGKAERFIQTSLRE